MRKLEEDILVESGILSAFLLAIILGLFDNEAANRVHGYKDLLRHLIFIVSASCRVA